ncbi:MAG: hypothetical protein EP329_00485 [Deltaproteobacteria bacterium]|nr:MAG: hypothetical protein EP329_00485 [Deltaproteobacteria bacterium]
MPTSSAFTNVIRALGLAAMLAAPAVVGACDTGGVTQGTDDRADHRCGPDFEDAACGTNRCCSSSDYCGGPTEPHCNALNGYGGAYDGPIQRSSSTSIDCAAFCGHQASVVAELGCANARSESDCLTACQATASNPAIESCKSELAADIACESQAPVSEYSCSDTEGEAPTLNIDAGSTCGDAVGAFLQCAVQGG